MNYRQKLETRSGQRTVASDDTQSQIKSVSLPENTPGHVPGARVSSKTEDGPTKGYTKGVGVDVAADESEEEAVGGVAVVAVDDVAGDTVVETPSRGETVVEGMSTLIGIGVADVGDVAEALPEVLDAEVAGIAAPHKYDVAPVPTPPR